MPQIKFDKSNNTWYRVSVNKENEALGYDTVLNIYDPNRTVEKWDDKLKKKVKVKSPGMAYKSLGKDGLMHDATKEDFDNYQAVVAPTTGQSLKRLILGDTKVEESPISLAGKFLNFEKTVGEALVNPVRIVSKAINDNLLSELTGGKNDDEATKYRKHILNERDAAIRRDRETVLDKEEDAKPYISSYFDVKNGNINSLSSEDRIKYDNDYSEKNEIVKKDSGEDLSDEFLYTMRVMNNLLGNDYSEQYGYNRNFDFLKAAYEDNENGNSQKLDLINYSIAVAMGNKYKDAAKKYELSPTSRSTDQKAGLTGRIAESNERSQRAMRKEVSFENMANSSIMELTERPSEIVKELVDIATGKDKYINPQRDRILKAINNAADEYEDFMMTYGRDADNVQHSDARDEEGRPLDPNERQKITRMKFIIDQVYADSREHADRLNLNTDDDYLRYYNKYSYMEGTLGTEAANKWLHDTLQNTDADNVCPIITPVTQMLNIIGDGALSTATGLINFVGGLPIAAITKGGDELLMAAEEALQNNIDEDNPLHPDLLYHFTDKNVWQLWFDNPFVNWGSDAETTGDIRPWVQNRRKWGQAYTADEIEALKDAGVITESEKKQYLKESARLEKASEWSLKPYIDYTNGTLNWSTENARQNLTLSHSKGSTGALTTWNYWADNGTTDKGKSKPFYVGTENSLFGWDTPARVVSVALQMYGVGVIGNGTAKLGSGIASYARMLQRANSIFGKASTSSKLIAGGWKGIEHLGNSLTKLSNSVASMSLDMGYAKSTYDSKMQEAYSTVESRDFQKIVDAYKKECTNNADMWQEVVSFMEAHNAIADKSDTDYIDRWSFDEALSNLVKIKYLQTANSVTSASAALTWAITGAVDLVNFNTIGKGLYGLPNATASKWKGMLGKKMIEKGKTSTIGIPEMFNWLDVKPVSEGGKAYVKDKVGKDYIRHNMLKSSTSSFISNYTQDLGVGAGDKYYSDVMGTFMEDYFNPETAKKVALLSDNYSKDYKSALALLGNEAGILWNDMWMGAAEAAPKLTSIRDGMYGALAGLFMTPRYNGRKKGFKKINEQDNRSLAQRIKDAIPMDVEFGLIDYYRGSNLQTTMINQAREEFVKSVNDIMSTPEGKALPLSITHMNSWYEKMLGAAQSGQADLANDLKDRSMVTSAFITSLLQNTDYGEAVLKHLNEVAERGEVSEKEIAKIINKVANLAAMKKNGTTPKENEKLTKEQQKIYNDILNLKVIDEGKDIADKNWKSIADKLNNYADGAREYIQMVADARYYTNEGALKTDVEDNYIFPQAYAELRIYHDFISRHSDKVADKYYKKAAEAHEKYNKEVEAKRQTRTESSQEVKNSPDYLSSVLRVIYNTPQKIEDHIESLKIRIREAKEEIVDNHNAYKSSVKAYSDDVSKKKKNPAHEVNAARIGRIISLTQSIEGMNRTIDQISAKLKKLKEVKKRFNEEDNSYISVDDILDLDYESLGYLLDAGIYKNLSENQKDAIKIAASMYTGIYNGDKALEQFRTDIRNIRRNYEIRDALRSEIDMALDDPEQFMTREEHLREALKAAFYKEEFVDFAKNEFTDYKDFVKQYKDLLQKIELTDNSSERLLGLQSALTDNPFYKQYINNKNNAEAVKRAIRLVASNDIDSSIWNALYKLIDDKCVENNLSLGGNLKFQNIMSEKQFLKEWEKIKQTLDTWINGLTAEELAKHLNKESLTTDQVDSYRNNLLEAITFVGDHIKSSEDRQRFNREDVNPDTKYETINEKYDRERKTAAEIYTQSKSIREFLKKMGLSSDMFLDQYDALSDEIKNDIKNIIEHYVNGDHVDVRIPNHKIAKTIINHLETKIFHYKMQASSKVQKEERRSGKVVNKGLIFGDTNSQDAEEKKRGELVDEYNVGDYLTGRYINAVGLNKGQLEVRLVRGGLFSGIGNNIYAVVIKVDSAVSKSDENADMGHTFSIGDGKGSSSYYQLIGFYEDTSNAVNDASKTTDIHIVNDGKKDYTAYITLHITATEEEENPTIINEKLTKGGVATRRYSLVKNENGRTVLKYTMTGAAQLLTNSNSITAEREVNYTDIDESYSENQYEDGGKTEKLTASRFAEKIETDEDFAKNNDPSSFNYFTKGFASTLKGILEKVKNDVARDGSKSAIESLLNNENSKNDKKSLKDYIYLANGYKYTLSTSTITNNQTGQEEVIVSLAISDATGDNQFNLASVPIENLTDGTLVRQAVLSILKGKAQDGIKDGDIRDDKSLILKSEESGKQLPICRWEVKWIGMTPPINGGFNLTNANNYIKAGALGYYKPVIQVKDVTVDEITTSDKKQKKDLEKQQAAEQKKNQAVVEEFKLGENPDEKESEKDPLKQITAEMNEFANNIRQILKSNFERFNQAAKRNPDDPTEHSWYEIQKKRASLWAEKHGLNWYISPRRNSTAFKEAQNKIRNEDNKHGMEVATTLGTMIDNFVRDFFSHAWYDNPNKINFEKYKGIFKDNDKGTKAIFTESELKTLAAALTKWSKDLGIGTRCDVLSVDILVGSKSIFGNELDLILIDKLNGTLYNIDIKTRPANGSTISQYLNRKEMEYSKPYSTDPSVKVSALEYYGRELATQRRWLEFVLRKAGMYAKGKPFIKIESSLLFINLNYSCNESKLGKARIDTRVEGNMNDSIGTITDTGWGDMHVDFGIELNRKAYHREPSSDGKSWVDVQEGDMMAEVKSNDDKNATIPLVEHIALKQENAELFEQAAKEEINARIEGGKAHDQFLEEGEAELLQQVEESPNNPLNNPAYKSRYEKLVEEGRKEDGDNKKPKTPEKDKLINNEKPKDGEVGLPRNPQVVKKKRPIIKSNNNKARVDTSDQVTSFIGIITPPLISSGIGMSLINEISPTLADQLLHCLG